MKIVTENLKQGYVPGKTICDDVINTMFKTSKTTIFGAKCLLNSMFQIFSHIFSNNNIIGALSLGYPVITGVREFIFLLDPFVRQKIVHFHVKSEKLLSAIKLQAYTCQRMFTRKTLNKSDLVNFYLNFYKNSAQLQMNGRT